MGLRYQAILKYLGEEYVGVDQFTPADEISILAGGSSRIIIASPTDTHFDYIKEFSNLRKPILCEKPITKSLEELLELEKIVLENHTPLTMMMQYERLVDDKADGFSYYDYFRHGNDGLGWDCFQVIALANGSVALAEKSPIWQCQINGEKLNIQDMDKAYLKFVEEWLWGMPRPASDYFDYHKKVHAWLNK